MISASFTWPAEVGGKYACKAQEPCKNKRKRRLQEAHPNTHQYRTSSTVKLPWDAGQSQAIQDGCSEGSQGRGRRNFGEDEIMDNMRWPQDICKAPKGSFRVIGKDTFPLPPEEYLVGDFPDLASAMKMSQEVLNRPMYEVYIYDDTGADVSYECV
jgi:hypothetical protein